MGDKTFSGYKFEYGEDCYDGINYLDKIAHSREEEEKEEFASLIEEAKKGGAAGFVARGKKFAILHKKDRTFGLIGKKDLG